VDSINGNRGNDSIDGRAVMTFFTAVAATTPSLAATAMILSPAIWEPYPTRGAHRLEGFMLVDRSARAAFAPRRRQGEGGAWEVKDLRIDSGCFPKPYKLMATAFRWRENEIEAWLAEVISSRG